MWPERKDDAPGKNCRLGELSTCIRVTSLEINQGRLSGELEK